MAKFICEFSEVTSIGKKITSAAKDFTSATNTYSNSIDTELSGWTGDAKNSFTSKKNGFVNSNLTDCNYISEFGEFIVSAAQKIEELESELSNLSI